MDFLKFYKKYRTLIFAIISIIVFIVLFFTDRKKEYGKYEGVNNFDH